MRDKFVLGIIIGIVIGISVTTTGVVLAGSLNASSTPASTSSYTLSDIYNRLSAGTAGSQSTFTEPSSGPGTTMHTLNAIMAAAPAVEAANGAAAADVISGKTFWGLGTGGAWGLQTGSFAFTGSRATVSSFGNISKVLNGIDSDGIPNGGDTETVNVRQLLNPESSDTLPAMIGVPSGYRYSTDGTTILDGEMPYPVSISTLLGTPKWDPFTGLPLVSSNTYNPGWVTCSTDCYFNMSAPIALRLRSVLSQLASSTYLQ